MRRRLAVYSMFALFALAYATLDRMPRSAIQVLRGASEHVTRVHEDGIQQAPEA